MAIELLDEERLEDNNEDYATFDDNPQEPEEETLETVEETEEDLPDKYKGKTPAEIAKMHQEAEKLLGRQSSEVGELRKIVDDFVKSQLETKAAPKQFNDTPEEEVDWYLEPDKAVAKAIENHPKIKEAETISAQMKQAKALQELQTKHPDFQEILSNDKFGEWVSGSKIRLQLFKQADTAYDVEAADELLSTWKERQQYTNQAVQQERQERKKQVKSASTGATSGSGEAPSRKVYRRADIIKLMQTDPDRYMTLADEIAQAYAEGRVKS
jgi:hypothetical protein